MVVIVLGTNNRKKGTELAELLTPYTIEVRTLDDFERKTDVIEDGQTFLDNARKKAVKLAQFLNAWVIGEDSGLCVDALGDAPGVYSARFAALSENKNSSDENNNRLLLEKMANVPLERRSARYVSTAVLADPAGTIHAETEGVCRGRILFEHSGDGGFGYDPLFEVIEYHKTFGTLLPVVKQTISHRARAMRKLIPLMIAAIK